MVMIIDVITSLNVMAFVLFYIAITSLKSMYDCMLHGMLVPNVVACS